MPDSYLHASRKAVAHPRFGHAGATIDELQAKKKHQSDLFIDLDSDLAASGLSTAAKVKNNIPPIN